jgi:hypothetical protein
VASSTVIIVSVGDAAGWVSTLILLFMGTTFGLQVPASLGVESGHVTKFSLAGCVAGLLSNGWVLSESSTHSHQLGPKGGRAVK